MTTKRSRMWVGMVMLLAVVASACGSKSGSTSSSGQPAASTPSGSGSTIKVGVLHSLSGTMAISEVSVRDAELMGHR